MLEYNSSTGRDMKPFKYSFVYKEFIRLPLKPGVIDDTMAARTRKSSLGFEIKSKLFL